MPTYEFVCTQCAAATDVRATIAEKQAGLTPRCDACGGASLRQAFPTVSLPGRERAAVATPAGCCGGACGCGSG